MYILSESQLCFFLDQFLIYIILHVIQILYVFFSFDRDISSILEVISEYIFSE